MIYKVHHVNSCQTARRFPFVNADSPAMTDQDNSYRPRSPDFSSSSFQSNFPPPAATSHAYQFNPLDHRSSYDASTFFTPQYQRPAATQQYVPPFSPIYPAQDFDMARRSSRIARASEVDPAPESKYLEEHSEPEPSEEMADYEPEPEPKPEPVALEQPVKEEVTEEVKSRPGEGIEVKTKFPVARIKRIMQADEDVGKVAQVTPIAVCTSSPTPLRSF